ncbi:MAG: hypothetical protein ACYDDF_09745 [Thermoplasmatota archaeon]
MKPGLIAVAALMLFAGCTLSPSNSGANSNSNSSTGNSNDTTSQHATLSPIHIEHNFSAAPENKTFTIPSNVGPLEIRLYYTGAGTGNQIVCTTPPGTSFRISAWTPTHALYSQANYTASGVVGSAGTDHCDTDKDQKGVTLQAGAWTVQFSGSAPGTLIGVLDVKNST